VTVVNEQSRHWNNFNQVHWKLWQPKC